MMDEQSIGAGFGDLAQLLEDAAVISAGGPSMSTVSCVRGALLLLLRAVCGESTGKAAAAAGSGPRSTASLAISLLERCAAPEAALLELRKWAGMGCPGAEVVGLEAVRTQLSNDTGVRTVAEHSAGQVASAEVVVRAPSKSRPPSASDVPRKGGLRRASNTSATSVSTVRKKTEILVDPSVKLMNGDDEPSAPSSPSSRRKAEKGGAEKVADRRRRFTVNLTSVPMPLPPTDESYALLRNVAQLKDCNDDELDKILSKAKCRRYEADEPILCFGASTEELHVLVSGTASVMVPHKVGVMKPGDFIGDQVLRIPNAINPTQVTAFNGPVTTISVTGSEFNALGLKTRMLEKGGKNRMARRFGDTTIFQLGRQNSQTGDMCEHTGFPLVSNYQKTDVDRSVIKEAIRNNRVLGEVLQLSEGQLAAMAEVTHLISVRRDEVVMRLGDRGSSLFVVHEGMLDICYSIDQELATRKSMDMAGEFRVRGGDSFGELGLLYDAPRSATVTAASECKLWTLPRTEFQVVARMTYTSRIDQYAAILKAVPYLNRILQPQHFSMVATIVEEISFLETEQVCTEGDDNGVLFMIFEGECRVSKEGRFLRYLKPGDYIGEDQIERDLPADCTVSVKSPDAVILALEMTALSMVTAALVDNSNESLLNNQDVAIQAKAIDKHHAQKAQQNRELQKAPEEEFWRTAATVGALGEGAFGLVYLMQRENGRHFALKAVNKAHVQESNCGKMLENERNTMALLDSDFVVRLYAAFHDEEHVYFAQEAILCGELFDLYHDRDLFGNIPAARFFAACVTLALQHIHLRRVIYRDLKLENCLVDERGYVKLTDMGIAKIVIGKTYTVCGTADYLAPETLRQVGHNRAVDWWALGVLIFIMVSGRAPFDAPEVTLIYKNIIKGWSKVKFPEKFPSDLVDVIKLLGRKRPEERVTMQKGGVDNLKEMAFFMGFDWDGLAAMQLEAPCLPKPVDLDSIKRKQLSRTVNFDPADAAAWNGPLENLGMQKLG
eukprot:TRINITY_DN80926_c0_g1_i1.p1 TRINITY_DN80926_c0_g1~~TRINITY_DN80926_c0_g1_i1.p1  ORF type:complete len:1008 (-),score=273.85 TRINITY_DN80926_c0_g1_i1:229-3252(-)